jgi:hypothetical protein
MAKATRVQFFKTAIVVIAACFLVTNLLAPKISAEKGDGAHVSLPSDFELDDPMTLGQLSPRLFPATAASQEKTVEQTQKNIQVLKGLPASQLYIVMNFMRASLGVSCAHCHVNSGGDKWEWEKDDKPAKQTARRMIRMVMEINKQHFDGLHAVSCYTCHRGDTEPAIAPPLPQAPPEGGPAGMKPTVALPTVDQVLEKYVQALGGKAAIEKTKTRVMNGTQLSSIGMSMPLVISQQAPNKFLAVMTTPQQATISRGYDGAVGWMKGPRGQRELAGDELAEMKRTADFFWMLKLRELAKDMSVMSKEKIGEREVYVLGVLVAPARIEKLYFDAQNGLLLRAITLEDSLVGWIPEQVDYEDYRDVDGVKMPFVIRQSYVDPWIGWTRRFTEVKTNVPVDEKGFELPKEK